MRLYIKNMVCHRCKLAVENALQQLGLHPIAVSLGEVLIEEQWLSKEVLGKLEESLKTLGFEFIDDRRSKQIEQIKTFVIDAIHHKDELPEKNFSELIAGHLHHDYSYLSKLFSEVEGITIEQYIITQKVEKVKELLMYDEQSLSQIAIDLGYSSTAHLSSQFKKITGLTPTVFKQIGQSRRRALDDIRNQK